MNFCASAAGQAGGSAVPASAQAAWRAAPSATYSAGCGQQHVRTHDGRGELLHRGIARRAADHQHPVGVDPSASTASASEQSKASTAARARSALVTAGGQTANHPGRASAGSGVRSPSRYGRNVNPPAPDAADRASSANSS